MASLVILYGQPSDPGAFEDYYTHHHIPCVRGEGGDLTE
jgi:hypothetical protein